MNMSVKTPEGQKRVMPPNQKAIKGILRWGRDHPGITKFIPKIEKDKWSLTIDGEVSNPVALKWQEFLRLPVIESLSDFHCVEGWSVLDCRWEGVRFAEIVSLVKPKECVTSATFACYDGYTTSLTLEELSGNNIILSYRLNGKDLDHELGGPMRLIVPAKYAYKSAMWINRITFTRDKERGYWEGRGYSDSADVWKNDRYSL